MVEATPEMGKTAQRRPQSVPTETESQASHLKLLPELLAALTALRWHRDVKVLALLLAQQLKPAGGQVPAQA